MKVALLNPKFTTTLRVYKMSKKLIDIIFSTKRIKLLADKFVSSRMHESSTYKFVSSRMDESSTYKFTSSKWIKLSIYFLILTLEAIEGPAREFVPLKLAYGKTAHTYQGQNAGPTPPGKPPNAVQTLVVDPGPLDFEGKNVGLFYSTATRATTVGRCGGK